jgi:hypothetical protein
LQSQRAFIRDIAWGGQENPQVKQASVRAVTRTHGMIISSVL